ncbi:isopeptide-forming domain-containing fimbrial protein [Enterococcus faecalis]|uniref:isopeptide-forming domain-containing fimbrial protein n=16 Tax=Enterococcus faecalis TaxID=1351 RepID=UPI00200FBD96|nr:isopeptide-forming domain-containing fimbrial protein [Enterococcus faecalis]UQF73796.1 isopeptide-forming domain-containing fimbrial protein [Enterococcus faecalis]
MFKKATKLLSTMVIVAGTVVGNFSPTLALAEGAVKAGDTEGMTNTVKVKDDSLADCKRILEGQAAFPVQAGETEPVDLVVVEDASGSFSDNFPHVRQAIDEVVQGLSDQDRVMLASYRGGKQFMFPDGKTKINSADYDMNVRVNTQLTYDKSQFVSGFGDVRTYGGTPTAPGLKLALDTYNQTHGDLTNRKTYFLLVTDGVANTRLDGYLHKTNTNDSINEYPDPRHPLQVSVEYSNDYQGAAAEVLALNQEITNQGYEMINAYWESVESLSSVNSYFDKYKTEVGPFVKQELQQGSSTPEDFITSQSIDDFTTQLKQIVKDRLAQSTPATASLTIADQFDIQSATATDDAGNDVPVQINGQTISATSTEGYVGNITIHYEVKENTAIDAATLVSSGTMNQGTIAKEFPEAMIPKNDNAHACDVTPEDPTITKDIEGQEHLDLTNRDQEFKWNVKAAFGNETSTWTQASMVDDINKVLDITDVKVTDENGKDVTANGTVTQENNKVTFEMNKQADSYDYLSGHTYTMTITTKIKTDATDEELAPYIEQGGIPNQADLNFGNEGDVLHSNKPTVTPPPVDPNIAKDVEGQDHLDLTNRDQAFKWNVKAAFGNETSTWTQASMVDEINQLLDITDVKVTDENGKDVTANGTVTQENNKVTFTMNKKDDSYSYLAGHTYTMTITTKIKAGATDEELAPYIEQGGIPNQADLNFGNEGDVLHSNKPTVTPPAPTPEDPTITKDIENQEHLDLTNRDQAFKWNVKTAFGNETSTWTQASMVDDINKVLDITDVKITDENGKDVTANGTVTQENNKVTFEMNKQADSYDYLSGHTYTMTITTKIKADATDEELAPYIEQGGIPNQADLNFGNEGDVLHSNKPTVTPPAPTPEDPTITKDIEGQEHLDLTNRDQEFKWNVKTAFGNETSTWTQASMVDDINKVLDITDVKVTDENGKDVTANGTVTQENNKVTFEMNKQADSYDYLSGHTYTMTITTKIKTDATDEELAPYIEQGGIPNQADLNFGNEGDVLHSNKPTVTPPPVDPNIAKDVEGQDHLDLTNRDQAFKWNVKAAFGNETSTWTQASMVDEINQLLDITDVKVTDENGKDVTANGTVTQENNKVTFTMNKKDDSYSYLAGHTYTMTITTKIKAGATDEELAPYIEQGGIPNQADLNFGNEGDVLHSNKPTVTPPAPTPEDPTITKDIENQEHLDLTNRDQAFKWNVKTAFGNETSTWTQASMVDDINKVLDITDVKITDENGKDVTANGTVTQENNKVTFEMNKQADSYDYLSGHTYTMTITTKIKADATDEELAPYIEQGGIPNQADLNFGNEGDVLHSNKPTVTPPAPTPEDPKKPKPKQPLKPKKPLTPTNHQAPTNPVNFGKSASKGIHLPMTNTTVNPLYMIAGLIVLIVAISFGITKNKKRKN